MTLAEHIIYIELSVSINAPSIKPFPMTLAKHITCISSSVPTNALSGNLSLMTLANTLLDIVGRFRLSHQLYAKAKKELSRVLMSVLWAHVTEERSNFELVAPRS